MCLPFPSYLNWRRRQGSQLTIQRLTPASRFISSCTCNSPTSVSDKGLTNTATHHISTTYIRIEREEGSKKVTRNDYESQLFRVLGLPFPGHSKALPASAVHLEHCPIWTRLVGFVGSFRGFLRYTRELSSMRAPTSSTRNDRAKRRAEAEAEQGA